MPIMERCWGNFRRMVTGLAVFLTAGALLLGVFAAGCGKSGGSGASDDEPAAVNPAAKPVDPSTASTVTGIVKFEGTPPKTRTIDMAAAATCAKMHTTPATTEIVVLGDNGTLQNTVVYLKGDFSAYSFARGTAPVKVDQNGCVFVPHVVGLMTGEPLQVINSDGATHNVNAISAHGQGWNESLEPGSAPLQRSFAHSEIAMPVKCNVHPWMKFYVAVLNHPYFQVVGKDGSFALRNVPPGSYTLVAWHEHYGVKEQPIVVKPNSDQNLAITFTDKDRP
jgi:plastocyanin